MHAMAYQMTNLTIVYSTVYSRRRSQKTSTFRVTGLCGGNAPMTWEFLAKKASNAENVSILWRHHCIVPLILIFWDVDEKHFTYAGFDHFSILISFYQLCWSFVFLFVVWDLLGKELTHICLCVWVTMNQQNSGTTGLIGVRQAYGWRVS